MVYLPALSLGDSYLTFPILMGTSQELAAFLIDVAEDRGQSECRPHAWVPDDPVVVVWAFLRSLCDGPEEYPASLVELGDRLRHCWTRWLSFSDADLTPPPMPLAGDVARLVERVLDRRRELGEEARRDVSAAGLWLYLENWRQWIDACQGSNEGRVPALTRPVLESAVRAIEAAASQERAVQRTPSPRARRSKSSSPNSQPAKAQSTVRQQCSLPSPSDAKSGDTPAGEVGPRETAPPDRPGFRGQFPAEWIPSLARLACRCHELSRDLDDRVAAARLEAMRNFAYGAGHEINNPLANISARAQALARGENDPDRRRALAAIHAQALRAHEMIADAMLFARPPRMESARCNLGRLVADVVERFRATLEGSAIGVSLNLPVNSVWVLADSSQLATAILALLQNSWEAMGDQGTIDVHVAMGAGDHPREMVALTIRDSGPGIPAEHRASIFDPFFSGREAGRGLGFGLSKAWRIVSDHGGLIRVENRPPPGAEFTILLPILPG